MAQTDVVVSWSLPETVPAALGLRDVKAVHATCRQKSLDTVNSEVLRALDDAMPGTPGTERALISRTDDYTGYA